MAFSHSEPISDQGHLYGECRKLIEANKETDALTLIKQHVNLINITFNQFLNNLFKTDDHRLEFARAFQNLTEDQLLAVLKSLGSELERHGLVVEKLDNIPAHVLPKILSACQTDSTRLDIARLFVAKFNERNTAFLVEALQTFQEDKIRLECVMSYQDKINIGNIIRFISLFIDPGFRYVFALKFKDIFATSLPLRTHVPDYCNVIALLDEERRKEFVSKCFDIIPPSALPPVIGKLKEEHRLAIASTYEFPKEQLPSGERRLAPPSSQALVEILPLLPSDTERLHVVKKYADVIPENYLSHILSKFGQNDSRLLVLGACEKNITISTFDQLLPLLSPLDRLKFAFRMREMPTVGALSIARVFPEAFSPKEDPQKLRQLMGEITPYIKANGLLSVIALFKGSQIEFLKALSPENLLEFVNSSQEWNALVSECGTAEDVAACFGMRVGTLYTEQLDFLRAMKKLTGESQGTNHSDPALHLKFAGQKVALAFEEAYRSDALNTSEKLKQFQEVAELVTTVMRSSDHNMQPLLDNLKVNPIQLGDKRIERIVLGAIGALICAALVAASITLALVSFGVLAPLTIATITLSANMLVAGLATAAAPVALGLGAGATFFAITGRTQGPALAVEQFVKQPKVG